MIALPMDRGEERMKRNRWTADFVLFCIAMIWGVTFVVVQEAVAEMPPLAFNAVRFSIASVFLLGILAVFYRQQLAQLNRKMVIAGMTLGVWLLGGYAFQTIGLQYTTSSKAGFITGLSVVLVPLFAWAFLRQKPTWASMAGAVLAVGGLYLLTLGDLSSINNGDLYILLCAVSFGLQIVFTGKYAPHFPTLGLAWIQISTVAVLCAVLSPWIEPDWRLAFDMATLTHPSVFWALVITAIPATALAFVAQTEFQKYTTAAHVALLFALEPVFAALTDVWYVGTQLSSIVLTGCGLILMGMILAEFPMEAVLKYMKRNKRTA
jgi:drug/metabolite transporter (DMT)-like permease